MNTIKQFLNTMIEAIIEARKARAASLVNSLRHGK
jgi:hypothetical protein